MTPLVRRMVRNAVQAYAAEDVEAARRVVTDDPAIDAIYGQIVRDVIAKATHDTTSMPGYIDLLSAAKNLERIADHATNIAEDVIYLSTGSIVRHRRTQ
jgi:phosphate transport system protein